MTEVVKIERAKGLPPKITQATYEMKEWCEQNNEWDKIPSESSILEKLKPFYPDK